MKPSEIRQRIEHDHETLRAMLFGMEKLALEVLEGEHKTLGALRLEGETLLGKLLEHMHWEDLYLRPALLETTGFGVARAERLDRDHEEQRELLRWALASVQDQSRPPLVVARQLLDLIRLLRDDMDDEEAVLVNQKVLRDDVIGVDVETG